MGRVTVNAPVTRYSGGRFASHPDVVAGEEPLQILLGGRAYTVTMRTPGHDVELVNGLLFSEGLIRSRGDIRGARYCAGDEGDGNTYNVIDIELAGADPALVGATARTAAATSACGICGAASIAALQARTIYPLTADRPLLEPRVVLSFQATLRERQRLFARTGGLHAAAVGSPTGELELIREDVGRHNAVDKVIGALLLRDALPAGDLVLVTSSRASFELVQKAVMAGIGVLVAASAPSSLAIDCAKAAGLTLIGFARAESFNVYAAPGRLAGAT